MGLRSTDTGTGWVKARAIVASITDFVPRLDDLQGETYFIAIVRSWANLAIGCRRVPSNCTVSANWTRFGVDGTLFAVVADRTQTVQQVAKVIS